MSYRGKIIPPQTVHRYGLATAKARIDRFHDQPENARQLMYDDFVIVAVWDDNLDDVGLRAKRYFPQMAYSCPPPADKRANWIPYSSGERVALDLTRPEAYLRTEGMGLVNSDSGGALVFPLFVASKNSHHNARLLYLYPAAMARRMADDLTTGANGMLPDEGKAGSIRAVYMLTTNWDDRLSDILLIQSDTVMLGMLMEHWAFQDDNDSLVRAMAAAYILNTTRSAHWTRRLTELRESIGQRHRHGLIGKTVDSQAREIVGEVANSRRDHEKADATRGGSYSENPALSFRDAALGFTRAAYAAGDILLNGKFGYPKDPATAARYFKFAASRSMPAAAHNLATCYRDGVGVPKDLDKAFFWYRQAAILGLPQSQLNLALCHKDGAGTETDEVAAYAWLTLWKESRLPPPTEHDGAAVNRLLEQASPSTKTKAIELVASIKIESENVCRQRADDKPWDIIIEP